MNANDRKILGKALSQLPASRRASLEGALFGDRTATMPRDVAQRVNVLIDTDFMLARLENTDKGLISPRSLRALEDLHKAVLEVSLSLGEDFGFEPHF
jgi:hypothetical protein